MATLNIFIIKNNLVFNYIGQHIQEGPPSIVKIQKCIVDVVN